MDGDNLRDSSTSTLTLEAAFERLVKTLLTFFSNLAVSVNLQSRAFSNDLEILGWPKSSLAAHASSRRQTRRIIILCVFFFSLWVSIFLNRRSVISRLLGTFSGRQCFLQSLKREAPCEFLFFIFFLFPITPTDITEIISDNKCGAITVRELSRTRERSGDQTWRA